MKIVMKVFSGRNQAFSDAFAFLAVHWKAVVIVAVPFLFLPLALLREKEAKCSYVICVMAFYWVTEVLPLPVTSLIPIVLFPVFGILSTEEVCLVYFKETNVMFLGGMIMAIAIEHCNLHKRIALKVLLIVGASPQRLMLGFMITTMFLSMWICNAAATAMMTPIVIAVLNELKKHDQNHSEEKPTPTGTVQAVISVQRFNHQTTTQIQRPFAAQAESRNDDGPSNDDICYFLGVAYAANIGGTGTITGTATNLTFKGIFESIFPRADGINFATWMQFNVPLMLFNTFLAWLWLQVLYMGLFRRKDSKKTTKDQENRIRKLMTDSYDQLGSLTYHEFSVLCLFLLDILLWFFRKPEFSAGWGPLFPEKVVKDATPAIAVAVLLFALPANLDFLKISEGKRKESSSLLNWKVLHEKFPFGIVLLLGGGFALSKASQASGLSNYVGNQLEVVKTLSPTFILALVVLSATFATEVSSNTAVANIMLPVLAKMSRVIRVHPLYLMMPATVSCSYAFMLPVATPPNAIVAAASNMRTSQMMKAGLGMNLICAGCLIVGFIFVGVPMCGLTSVPDWADEGNATAVGA